MSEIELNMWQKDYPSYEKLKKIKIIVVGDHGTGKTWLLQELCHRKYYEKLSHKTNGCDIHVYKPDFEAN